MMDVFSYFMLRGPSNSLEITRMGKQHWKVTVMSGLGERVVLDVKNVKDLKLKGVKLTYE